MSKKHLIFFTIIVLIMLAYFMVGHFQMADDGFQYEGFTEALAHGHLDFASFYGFQGLSFFAVPIFWLTGSHNSIIIASIIFVLLSLPLVYLVARDLFKSERAGIYGLILFLLMPYTYTTLMRGFQEAALLFFILLIVYGSLNYKKWTPISWAVGSIVKPFALTLFPLFIKESWSKKKRWWLIAGVLIGIIYLGASYYQTGHFINDAAINSYQGNYNTASIPSLTKSFELGFKNFGRIGANLLIAPRKILISPFVILLGVFALLFRKDVPWRWKLVWSIILNFVLVGLLTFSFAKYLLPAAVLLMLASIYVLQKYKWLMVLVFADSISVFLPIWGYFGKNYWPNIYVYLIPFWLAIGIYIFVERNSFQFKI